MFDIINDPMFIQTLGSIALVFSLLVFQVNSKRRMLFLHSGSSLFYAVHFFLLGGYSGAVVNFVNAIRNTTFFSLRHKKRSLFLPILFIVLYMSVVVLTWKDIYSILPLIGAVFGTLAFWQKNPRMIRIFSLLVAPPWFIYATLVGSVPMMISESIMFLSDLIGLIRYDYHPKFTLRDFDLHHSKKLAFKRWHI